MPKDTPSSNDQTESIRASTQFGPAGRTCLLSVGEYDERGATVRYIYACDADYVVYYSSFGPDGTERLATRPRLPFRRGRSNAANGFHLEGVQAQLTPDPAKRTKLRAALLPLGVNRAKLQALLSGWPRRRSYDSSIATALQMAMDSDGNADAAKQAQQVLDDARASIVNERAIAGKAQYARFTVYLAIPLLLLLFIAQHNLFKDSNNFWLGTQAGVLGAIMSIALGLRQRTELLDIGRAGNLSDSGLRLMIGALSGGTLVLLFSTGLLPTLKTAQGALDGIHSTQFILMLGIMAGFAEKLVPSLLEEENKRLGNSGGAGAGSGTGGNAGAPNAGAAAPGGQSAAQNAGQAAQAGQPAAQHGG